MHPNVVAIEPVDEALPDVKVWYSRLRCQTLCRHPRGCQEFVIFSLQMALDRFGEALQSGIHFDGHPP